MRDSDRQSLRAKCVLALREAEVLSLREAMAWMKSLGV